jgi:hypothetical protein
METKELHCRSHTLLEKLHVEEDGVGTAAAGLCLAAEGQPVGKGEVARFGAIEAVVEATVIAAGERDHELARVLRDLSAEQAVLLERGWRDEIRLVAQKLFAFGIGVAEVAPSNGVEAFSVTRPDAIPALRRPKVQVIDTIQLHVLRMPSEEGLPHPEVQVRLCDTRQLAV